MNRTVRLFATLLVCIAMMPGWIELLENVEHLAHDGHLAHFSDHTGDEEASHHAVLEAEHGCTPTNHTCSCHVSVPILLPDAFALETKVGRLLKQQRPALGFELVQVSSSSVSVETRSKRRARSSTT